MRVAENTETLLKRDTTQVVDASRNVRRCVGVEELERPNATQMRSFTTSGLALIFTWNICDSFVRQFEVFFRNYS